MKKATYVKGVEKRGASGRVWRLDPPLLGSEHALFAKETNGEHTGLTPCDPEGNLGIDDTGMEDAQFVMMFKASLVPDAAAAFGLLGYEAEGGAE